MEPNHINPIGSAAANMGPFGGIFPQVNCGAVPALTLKCARAHTGYAFI